MKERGRLWQNMVMKWDLPGENIPGGTLVEILDGKRVLIEGQKGVIRYDPEEVCIKTKDGHLRICGIDLHVGVMSKDQLVICGQILAVNICRRC